MANPPTLNKIICPDCGCPMVPEGTKKDFITKIVKAKWRCLQCRRWTLE